MIHIITSTTTIRILGIVSSNMLNYHTYFTYSIHYIYKNPDIHWCYNYYNYYIRYSIAIITFAVFFSTFLPLSLVVLSRQMGALCASVQQPLCRHVNSTGPVSGAHIPMLMAAPGSWHQWLVTLCHQKNSLKSSLVDDYPLVNIQKAIENGHWNSWFTHKRRWFSVVFCKFTRPGILRDLIAMQEWDGKALIPSEICLKL